MSIIVRIINIQAVPQKSIVCIEKFLCNYKCAPRECSFSYKVMFILLLLYSNSPCVTRSLTYCDFYTDSSLMDDI